MSNTFVVECYWPGVDELQLTEMVQRIATDDGASWMNSILIPDDEIVLCLVEAASADAVRATARRAGLPAERIVSCVQVGTRVQPTEGKESR